MNAPSLSELASTITTSRPDSRCDVRREGDVAVDAGEILQLVEVADDLFRLGADALHRFGDHVGRVVAHRDPPQQRIAHLDLGFLQPIDERYGALGHLVLGVEANRAEVVGIDLAPVIRLFQQRLGLAASERGLADDRHVPAHLPARIDDARQESGIHAPGHDRLRAGILHAQQLRLEVGIRGVDIALIDDLGAQLLEHRHIGVDRGGAVAGGVADDGDLLLLEHLRHIAVGGAADLLVGRRVAEAHRIFLRVGQGVDPARMDLRRVGAREQRHHRERLAGIDRPEHAADLLAAGEFGRAVHRLGRIALGVPRDQLELPAVDAAGGVDFLHGKLDAAVDPDAGGGRGSGERRQITDRNRILGGDGGLGNRGGENGSAGRQRLTTSQLHLDFLPKRSYCSQVFVRGSLGPRFLCLAGRL